MNPDQNNGHILTYEEWLKSFRFDGTDDADFVKKMAKELCAVFDGYMITPTIQHENECFPAFSRLFVGDDVESISNKLKSYSIEHNCRNIFYSAYTCRMIDHNTYKQIEGIIIRIASLPNVGNTHFESLVKEKKKQLDVLTQQYNDLLKQCQHTTLEPKRDYFSGSYYNRCYTSYYDQCVICGKRFNVRDVMGSSYG